MSLIKTKPVILNLGGKKKNHLTSKISDNIPIYAQHESHGIKRKKLAEKITGIWISLNKLP